jgi:hypothetical protein
MEAEAFLAAMNGLKLPDGRDRLVREAASLVCAATHQRRSGGQKYASAERNGPTSMRRPGRMEHLPLKYCVRIHNRLLASSSTIKPTPSENFSSASSPSRCTCKKDPRDTGVKYTLPFRLMGSRRLSMDPGKPRFSVRMQPEPNYPSIHLSGEGWNFPRPERRRGQAKLADGGWDNSSRRKRRAICPRHNF